MTRYAGPTPAVLAIVKARDLGWCLYCRERPATETHHRIGRGMGGTKRPEVNRPSALVSLCSPCHHFFTVQPSAAYAWGWSVRRNSVDLPTDIAMTDAAGRVFKLTDSGKVVPVTGGGLLPEHPENEVLPW